MISLAVLLLAPPVLAAEPDSAHHLAQARLFARRGWTEDAWLELEAALATASGAQSPEAHALAAELAWRRRDALRAAAHHERVAELTGNAEEREAAAAAAESLRRRFGGLVLRAPRDGMATRVQLDGGPRLIDNRVRAYVHDLTLQLRNREPLPREVALPVGVWLVNGTEVEVVAGEATVLTLPMDAIGRRGMASLQVLRLEATAGLELTGGATATALLPSPTVELGLTMPVSDWLVGVTATSTIQGVRGDDDMNRRGPAAVAVGVRGGAELQTASPLAVRPAATLRARRQPGLRPPCDGAGCVSELQQIWQVGPGVEIALDYREAGRTTAFGSGVRFAADVPIGVAGGTLVVTPALRLMGALSFAF